MTSKEINSKALRLFNRWKRDFRGNTPTQDFYEQRKAFAKECLALHSVVGAYDVLSPLNALKMASICSSIRFVEPYRMMAQLQKVTKTY